MHWKALRDCGFWRGVIAVCSSRTPNDYRDFLRRRGVDFIVVGDDRVDLPAALDALGARYGAMLVRTESGGALNRALMAHGLVDEVSVVLLPVAGVDSHGAGDPRVAGVSVAAPLALALEAVEPLDGGGVWLRYRRRG